MKTLLRLLAVWLLVINVYATTTWSEFYSQTTGDNLNAGSTTNDAAVYTFASGNWTNSSGIFFLSGADLSGVTVGMWASVYTNGNTQTFFVGRVTAVDDTGDTITASLTAKSGTAPANDVGGMTCKVGGAWKGPNAAVGFPFDFVSGSMTNSGWASPRVNMKVGTNSITANIIDSNNSGPVQFEGYTSTPGDGGVATIDGGTAGASYILLTMSGKNRVYKNIIFQNNGATGSASGVLGSGTENALIRCVIHNIRGNGVEYTAVNHVYGCEAYFCNQNNSTSKGGFNLTSSGIMASDCISHHNTNANCAGFQLDGGINLVNCIAANNGASGVRATADVTQTMYGLASYGNGNAGIEISGNAGSITDPMLVNILHCAIVSNSGAGIRMNNVANARYLNGRFTGIAFGSGTQTNAAGNFLSSDGVSQDGSNFYGLNVENITVLAADVTPWTAPVTGDFRINLAAAKSASTNFYTQTYTNTTFTGTIGYSDFGSAQHLDSGGTATLEHSHVFAQ